MVSDNSQKSQKVDATAKKVRVIIVDDSAVIRRILTKHLSKDPRLEVVGAAEDPYEARDMIVKLRPDVITLDLEMPRMNGLEFISILMKNWPIPIIVVSSAVEGNCEISLMALELGAIDVFPKPQADLAKNIPKVMANLADIVFNAATAKVFEQRSEKMDVIQDRIQQPSEKVIAIGASTGGTEAIRRILERLPSSVPSVIIVQHMPPGFTQSFAKRLNRICSELEVLEASDGEYLKPGLALVAPGDKHMLLKKAGARFYVEIKKAPRVNRHRPSIDVLFLSTAEAAGKNAVGVILTGMGSDGAKGLLSMRQAGARTLAQDETSSVVYGMPREAYQNGGAEKVIPIDQMAPTIIGLLK